MEELGLMVALSAVAVGIAAILVLRLRQQRRTDGKDHT